MNGEVLGYFLFVRTTCISATHESDFYTTPLIIKAARHFLDVALHHPIRVLELP
jgi:hypothetical protein